MAWLTGWKYRKSITLSRVSGAVTNYQMKLLLGESSGATGESVDCGGLCLSTFNDIRFTKSDGYTLLDYWIESLSGTTPNQLATIWIEFDSIGTTNTTFYMYYGKSDATSVSNGINTFSFFDDFLGTDLDGNKWTTVASSTVNVASSEVVITGRAAANSTICSNSAFGQNYAMRSRVKTEHFNSASYREFGGFRDSSSGNEYGLTISCHDLLNGKHVNNTGANQTSSAVLGGISAGTYSIWDIIRNSGTSIIYKQNDTNTVTITTYYPTANCVLDFEAGTSTDAKIYIDWTFVRQYLSTEPTWDTWGSMDYEWLTGWKYRKSITLSRSSGVVNNYQMKLLVGETSGATGENVDCAGLCLSNFNDIRFTNSNGTTLLDYWIESITGVSPNQLATIWIEFDTIGVDATTFYMYYGNSSATSLSNGTNTFIKFDGFEWGSQGSNLTFSGGSNIWASLQGVATIDTSTYYGTGTKSARFPGASPYPVYTIPYAQNESSSIQVRVYKETAVVNGPNLSQGNGTKRWSIWVNSSELIYYYTGSSISTGISMTADTWQLFEFNNFNWSAGTYDIWLNGTKITTGATMENSSAYSGVFAITHADTTAANDAWYDNIIVRNWVATEPAWGTWSTTLEYVDSYTKLLIHGDRNLGMVDSATGKTITVVGGAAISSGKTITTNGNAAIVSGRIVTAYGNAQLSTLQSKFGGASGLFDGTDDRITVPASSDFDFGTGDFTIDFWVYFTSITGSQYFFDIGINNSLLNYNTGVWTIRNPTSTTILSYTYTPSINIWIHVAIGRNGTNWYFFTNGILRTIATSSLTFGAANLAFTVGNYGSGADYGVKGYMDEFRVSKGILRWTTDFNVSTTPYETDSYTKLLLHFNDTTTFYDHSLCRPYFGDVGYFDGVGDYITLADSPDWYLGTDNFTIDFWFNLKAFPPLNDYFGICGQRDATNTRFDIVLFNTDGSYYFLFYCTNSTGGYLTNALPLSLNTWYHFAMVRDGLTSTKTFLNGTLNLIYTTNYTVENLTTVYMIGYNNVTYFNGYLDEFRVSKGIARWTSNFTPPTVPYDSDSYTKLLIHFNNISGATTFYDCSITRPNFNESIYFNGSTGYLILGDSDDWYFGTGDFTIDCWIKYTNTGTDHVIISQYENSTNRWYFYIKDDYVFGLQQGGSYSYFGTATTNDNNWHHVAFVGRYNFICVYVDGIFKGSITYYVPFSNFTGNLAIGSRYLTSWTFNFGGYIDEFRISKGIARWIDNFIPPTEEYFTSSILPTLTVKRPLCTYSGVIKELSVGDSIVIAGEYQLTYASTISIDFTSYNIQSVILTGNTIFTLNNIVNGKHCSLVVTQDSAGNRIATFNNTIKWYQGITPTLSTASSMTDIFTFVKSRDTLYGYCSKAFQVGS